MVVAAPAAPAAGKAGVRFVHAVPGEGAAQLTVTPEGDGSTARLVARFARPGTYTEVPSGSVELELSFDGDDGRDNESVTLEDGGRYTVVAIGESADASLRMYRDGSARARRARLRFIHAAPELGTVDVELGGRTAASGMDFSDASSYRSLGPGTADLAVVRAEDSGGALVRRRDLPLTAGQASTAVIVGSGGERLRVVPLSDAAATPRGSPRTGLGGLAREEDGTRWLAVLLGGLVAGALGAAAYGAAGAGRHARRSSRGG